MTRLLWLLVLALFTSSALAHPGSGIVVDQTGQVFFTDNGGDRGLLWKIDTEGKLTRFHNAGWHWLALDEKGNYSAENLKKWWDQRITMNFDRVPLPESRAALLQSNGAPFVVARDGHLYWAKGNLEIARLSPAGKVSLLGDTLKDTTDKLGGIKGLASGPDGAIYASCPNAIFKVYQDGKLEFVFYPITIGDADWDLPAGTPDEHKAYLRGLAVDAGGTMYAAASGARVVIKVASQGNLWKLDVVLKAEKPWSPTGVAVHGHDVYVLEYANANSDNHDEWLPRVRKLGRDGKVTVVATISKKDRER
jgi:hypothetical protein